jgi:hypothetical protein
MRILFFICLGYTFTGVIPLFQFIKLVMEPKWLEWWEAAVCWLFIALWVASAYVLLANWSQFIG